MAQKSRIPQNPGPEKLSLTLAVGCIDPGQFHVQATAGFRSGELNVKLGIMGGGHYLLFQQGEQAVSEVLSPLVVQSELPLTRFDDFLKGKIVEGRPAGLNYRFQAQQLEENSSEGRKQLQRLREKASQQAQQRGGMGLQENFPTGQSGMEGESIMAGQIDGDNRMTAETIHRYPAQGIVILTHTQIAEPSAKE